MLSIVLLLLKIIGFLLLAILLLLLTLLLVVLLVPVRYRGQAAFYGKPEGSVRVTWLFHLISVKVSYQGELDLVIRLAGIRILKGLLSKEEEGEDTAKKQAEEKAGEAAVPPEGGISAKPGSTSEPGMEPGTDAVPEPGLIQESGEEAESEILLGTAELRTEDGMMGASGPDADGWDDGTDRTGRISGLFCSFMSRIRGLFSRIRALAEKVKALFLGLWKKGQEADQLRRKALAFLGEEKNQKTIALAKRQVWKVIRHVLPRHLSGKMTFGLEDPYTMGQVLSAAAFLYPLYGKNFQLTPVFDTAVIEGEGKLRGRIRLASLLFPAIRVLLDRNFRKLVKQILNRGGNEDGR